VESYYDGPNVVHGPSVWGVGLKTSIVGPHTTTILPQRGGVVPPPLWSIPSLQTPLVNLIIVIDHSQRWWHEGVWGVVLHTMEEEEVCTIVLGHQVLI
jgi:hypothetical protein